MLQTVITRIEFLSVLRNRNFRVYSIGLVASVVAQQSLVATQAWLVFHLTASPAALGLVGGVHAAPGIIVTLLGGAFADRYNPRNIILIAQSSSALLMALMATLVIMGWIEVWHILAITFFVGIAQSFDSPARRTVWPPMIQRTEFVYAISISQTIWNGTRIIAPGMAGLIIATVGVATGDEQDGAGISLYVSFMGFLAMAVAMRMVRMPKMKRSSGESILHDVADGLLFVRRNRVFIYLLGISLASGYFGLSYLFLMPVFAEKYLSTGAGGYGLLLSAGGFGALVGVFSVASFGQYQDRSWVLIGSASVAGGSVIVFAATSAFVGSYALAIGLMIVTGAAFGVLQVTTGTSVNLLVPDEYRGRVMGLRGIMFNLAPLGSLQAGLIASAVNTPFAVGLGGAVLLGVAMFIYGASWEVRHLRQMVAQATAAQMEKM